MDWLQRHIDEIIDNLQYGDLSQVSIWCHVKTLKEDRKELDELINKYKNAETK